MGFNKLDQQQVIKLLTLLTLLLATSSCAFLNKEQGYVDDKPQNSPSNWERNSFGIGF